MQSMRMTSATTPLGSSPTRLKIAGLDAFRVLLVEDDPEYARMVERILRNARPPLWVHREERMDAALRRLERSPYDAMIVDLSLPDGEGRSTLESACAVSERLPVIVLTATVDEALALDAIRSGAQDFLVKQRMHTLSLPGAVMRSIERHRLTRARSATPDPKPEPVAGEALLLLALESALARGQRRGEPVSLILAGYEDLDWLTRTFGSDSVDQVMERARGLLSRSVRLGDTLARIGSHRFALVVEGNAHPETMARLADEMGHALENLSMRTGAGNAPMNLNARVGLATSVEHGANAAALLESAHAAFVSGPTSPLDDRSPAGDLRFSFGT